MVVVFGSLNADLIFAVASLPTPGQTLLASELSVEAGGKGANQAVAAALDLAPVVMVAAVGRDAMAEVALGGLRAAGVDISRVAVCSEPTGCASICTDQEGRNQIVVAPGANAATRASGLEDGLLGPAAVVVTQMEADPAQTAALIRRAKASGARTVHNLAPAAPLPGDALRALDVLVVNEDEGAWLARHEGAAADDAAALSACLGITVVRTLGAAGVEWAGPLGSGQAAAAAITAVDTTAAGDCFVGVLAATLDRGLGLEAAVRRANTAAGLACSRQGSQRSLPTASQIDRAHGSLP